MGFERQMYISKDDKKKVSMFPRQIRSLKNSKRDHIEWTPVHMNLSLCTQTCNIYTCIIIILKQELCDLIEMDIGDMHHLIYLSIIYMYDNV